MNKKQFDVLVSHLDGSNSQRKIADLTGYSLGTVNTVIKELISLGLLKDGLITAKGFDSLKPYECKRAIFIAAGFGSRLVPITLNTPKPLVRVHGKRIIDGLLDACLKAGIREIYIVRGYLKDQFDELLIKYPMIKFIDNPLFNDANNISSALLSKDLLCNAYVFEADLLIANPNIICKYHYSSDFLAIPVQRTDDWCFETKNGFISEEKVGGINCFQMVGISYWNEEDGIKLAKHIPETFCLPGGKERYWEQVPLVVFKNEYKVSIKECKLEDIVEIDSFKELCAIDKAYEVK